MAEWVSGIHNMHCAIVASGAILCYLDITQHNQIGHITTLSRIEEDRYVRLDKFTIRNLELIDSMSEDGKSLLSVIDRTLSPMGARLLRRWILFPLKDVEQINRRLNVVEHFFKDTEGRELLKQQLIIIEGGNISEAKIVCELQEDETRLFRFNLYGKED